jgi:hypothetical protein
MCPGSTLNGLFWSAIRLVVQTIFDWTDAQSTGDIGVTGSHAGATGYCAAKCVLWDTALQQPVGSPSEPS